jgi:hypothetical protein
VGFVSSFVVFIIKYKNKQTYTHTHTHTQVQSGKEAAPDWWDIDVEEDLQSRSGRPSAAEGGSARANAGDVPERNPAQEVDRCLNLNPKPKPKPKPYPKP